MSKIKIPVYGSDQESILLELEVLVDDDLYDILKIHNWDLRYSSKMWRCGRTSHGKYYTIYNVVYELKIGKIPNDYVIDHINRNGLDNRIINLRLASKAENSRNRIGNKNSTSKYKGVSWNTNSGKWTAQIRLGNIYHSLGYFLLEKDAAKAYDKKAKELFGIYAYLNFKEKE